MNKTFKEVHKEEQELENTLASVWGYDLRSNIADPKHKKHKQKHMPAVASITLRQFVTEIPKTERIQQVEDSIKAQQNERKLIQEHEKAVAAAANG